MPVQLSVFQLPGGARCLREDCAGEVTVEDTRVILQQTDPGGPFHGLPILALTEKMTSVTADARGMIAGRGDVSGKEVWMAVVMTNPVLRVTINFMMRILKNRKVRLFNREAEAIQWLDERVREDTARGTPPVT